MKVRYWIPVLLLVFVFSFMGCKTTTTETTAAAETTTAATETTRTATTTVIAPKTQTYFHDGRNFSDGVAWVKRDASYWECIDNKGNTLFSLGKDSIPLSDFTEGAAFIETTDSKNTKEKKLVNKSGKVVFPIDDGNKYQFVSSYGNYNFVTRHINTFEKTEDQTGIVDNTGKWILEPTPDLTAEWFPSSSLLAFGILEVNYQRNNYYDAHSNEFFSTHVADNDWDDNYTELMRRTVEYTYVDDLIFLVNKPINPYAESESILQSPSSPTTSSFYPGSYLSELGFINKGTGFYNRSYNIAFDLSSYKDAESIC
jgi:hypothetical protein